MRIILFITLLLSGEFALAQHQISNIRVAYTGQQITVNYDIEQAKNGEYFEVDVTFYNESRIKLNAATVTGDVGQNISGGKNKQVIWLVKTDNITFKGNLLVEVRAFPKQKVAVVNHILKSAIMPGWGDYRLNNSKWHFYKGLLYSASIAGGLYLNNSAYNNYQNYLNADNTSDADKYFNLATSQVAQSGLAFGLGAVTWTFSLTNTVVKSKKLSKKSVIAAEVSKYYSSGSKLPIIGYSSLIYVDIKGTFYPANISFVEPNPVKVVVYNNQPVNMLKANTSAKLVVNIVNKGKGTGYNTKLVVKELNKIKGIDFASETIIGNLKSDEKKEVVLPVSTDMYLQDGIARFVIEVTEENNFGTDPLELNIKTQKLLEPNIVVSDYKFTTEQGGVPTRKEKIFLQVNVQNLGKGDASNVKVKFITPKDVTDLSDQSAYTFATLKAGEAKVLNFEFIASNAYRDSIIPVNVILQEDYGRFAKNKDLKVSLKQELAKRLNIISNNSPDKEIKPVLLRSDVDINIPYNEQKFKNKFALIIGNEDYKGKQPDLSSESNVDFAVNDARIFKEYLIQTLGFPESNVFMVVNATSGIMKAELKRISELFNRINAKESEIVFFYAGHGFPDEETKVPYLMPVDVNVNNLSNAVKLSDVYETLAATNAKRITIFLDACFTGDGRTSGLLAARSVRIRPQEAQARGNMIVFSAGNGMQTALPYRDQYHGYFTYFLLKKLQETKGNVNYETLYNYIKENVSVETTRTLKPQDPELQISPNVSDVWKNWQMR